MYCGLCRSMRKSVGKLCEMTLSYDFVFLALLAMSWNGDEIKLEMRRCPYNPIKKKPMVISSPTLQKVASASAILSYHKVRDDISDKRGLKKIPPILALPFVSAMKRSAMPLDGLNEKVKASLDELSSLEKEGCSSPDKAADCFGKLLGDVFVSVTDGEKEKRLAYSAGMSCGRFIYLADALDDVFDDEKKKSYNPFNPSDLPSPESSRTALTASLYGLETAFDLTDFADAGIESIVRNVMYLGLPHVTENIIKKIYPDSTNN